MKIFTVTLNVAIDVHYYVPSFNAGEVCYTSRADRYAGGKGINIARALRENGVPCTAIAAVGQENAAEFLRLLDTACELIETPGRTRENITIHSPRQETRICADIYGADESLLFYVGQKLLDECDEDSIVTFSGRLPNGISPAAAAAFLEKVKARGAKLVVDCSNMPFEDVVRLKPWLIKPNEDEIALLSRDYEYAARRLADSGVENVIVSLGAKGALFCSADEFIRASVPKIENAYATGAGDASIAGFIAQEGSARERFVTALAYGSASCMREGMLPPLAKDIREIRSKIVCQ
ncbi:MAG: hexose kinase [Clostridia bacterium]|nr:hexose kinase [Clostridia bacterium]